MSEENIFKIGEPIPKVWLHCEFDFLDTLKYLNGAVIKTQDELNRLINKYLA